MKAITEQCETCGIVSGGAICNEGISDYRGHRLCSECRRTWKQLEVKHHKKLDYNNFKGWGNHMKKHAVAPYPEKLVIPDGMTLCRQCGGVGCKICGGKGYYQKRKKGKK